MPTGGRIAKIKTSLGYNMKLRLRKTHTGA